MKGIIFTSFATFTEEEFGLDTWQRVLDEARPESEGIYISTKQYRDDELGALVNQLAHETVKSAKEIERSFGQWCFPHLYRLAPDVTRTITDFCEYLSAVDSLIHIEVKKLYPGAVTPEIKTVNQVDQVISVRYGSPRKLCYFCEGLIYACARQFGLDVVISQSKCMHDDDEYCQLDIEL